MRLLLNSRKDAFVLHNICHAITCGLNKSHINYPELINELYNQRCNVLEQLSKLELACLNTEKVSTQLNPTSDTPTPQLVIFHKKLHPRTKKLIFDRLNNKYINHTPEFITYMSNDIQVLVDMAREKIKGLREQLKNLRNQQSQFELELSAIARNKYQINNALGKAYTPSYIGAWLSLTFAPHNQPANATINDFNVVRNTATRPYSYYLLEQ